MNTLSMNIRAQYLHIVPPPLLSPDIYSRLNFDNLQIELM